MKATLVEYMYKLVKLQVCVNMQVKMFNFSVLGHGLENFVHSPKVTFVTIFHSMMWCLLV